MRPSATSTSDVTPPRLSCSHRESTRLSSSNRQTLSRQSGAPGRPPRRISRHSTSLRTVADARLIACAAFSPAISHYEILQQDEPPIATDSTIEQKEAQPHRTSSNPPMPPASPAAWSFDAALLFVDISGFTNLCTRLDVDKLQAHINRYFTNLIDVVSRNNGDVVRFAGDAILCSWSLRAGSSEAVQALAVRTACRCALELGESCGTYLIPELGATLSIHSGIGVGQVSGFRVGTSDRWEIFLSGDPLRQACLLMPDS